jgi:hypothetical protein
VAAEGGEMKSYLKQRGALRGRRRRRRYELCRAGRSAGCGSRSPTTGNQSRSLVRLIQRGRVRAGGAAARSGQADATALRPAHRVRRRRAAFRTAPIGLPARWSALAMMPGRHGRTATARGGGGSGAARAAQ